MLVPLMAEQNELRLGERKFGDSLPVYCMVRGAATPSHRLKGFEVICI
jgi:hypothetical protein